MRVLIIGCGYLGVALGTKLARQGHQVFGLRRSTSAIVELAASGIVSLTGNVTDPASLERLPASYDWVVNAISSNKGGIEEYRAIYLDGTRNVLRWLQNIIKYIFISSTSVYAQTDGSIVTEQSAAEGASATSRVLLEAESLLLDRDQFPALILRASSIYGPGRGHLFQQFLKGEASLTKDSNRFLNMIDRDDLAGATIAALERGQPGQIYNATDDEPVSELDFFRWLSERLGRPMPAVRSEPEPRARKRGSTNKRVSNQKLKSDLGYTFRFPTYREGYALEIQRLQTQQQP